MKQRITGEQIKELTQEQRKNLFKLWENNTYDEVYGIEEGDRLYNYPLLSIGQMIELLSSKGNIGIEQWKGYWKAYYRNSLQTYNGELADCLWSAVKEVL